MKKIIGLTLLCLFSLTLMSSETIELAVGEWAPYISEKMENDGFNGEIVRAALATQGYDVKYLYYPWERSRTLIKNGNKLGTFPWSKTTKRTSYAFFSNAILTASEVFFYKKSAFPSGITYEVMSELSKYRIGGIRGYKHVDIMKKAGIDPDITADAETGFKKLDAGRIALMPEAELVGWKILEKLFPERKNEFATISKPVSTSEMYIMFSKNYPNAQKYLDIFNKGLEEIKQNGTFDSILEKYKM